MPNSVAVPGRPRRALGMDVDERPGRSGQFALSQGTTSGKRFQRAYDLPPSCLGIKGSSSDRLSIEESPRLGPRRTSRRPQRQGRYALPSLRLDAQVALPGAAVGRGFDRRPTVPPARTGANLDAFVSAGLPPSADSTSRGVRFRRWPTGSGRRRADGPEDAAGSDFKLEARGGSRLTADG
ncbi:hypothetical protein ACHAWF_012395 [Thalassiosira exigua]